jgi:hypothetical protein
MTNYIVLRTGYISAKNVVRETAFCRNPEEATKIENQWKLEGKRDIEIKFTVEKISDLDQIRKLEQDDKALDRHCY